MHTRSTVPPIGHHPSMMVGIATRAGQIALSFVAIAAILFLAAGRLDWVWAWMFLGISLVSVMINGAFMLRHSPATIAERAQLGAMQRWDKVVSSLWAATQYLALPLVAGLDLRFGWSPALNTGWHVLGVLVFTAGLIFSGWAMLSNAYFSTVVRIQHDRGHTVCRTGPYRVVRHPGYAGFMLQSLSIPVLLGSWWALPFGIVAVALMTIRTRFEDRLLHAELDGYQDYARDVRYRLVPGVW